MNTSSNNAAAAGGGENVSPGGQQKSIKTNVCLICGIYTNLSLNIFEPRSGPDIREVIYQKYNFKAERNDNEDKYICYSCNNWLINWYTLQYLSESQNYKPIPSSSSQQQSEKRSKRSKTGHTNAGPSKNKENLEQDNYITSTVTVNEMYSRRINHKKSIQCVLNKPVQRSMISCSSNTPIKSLENNLILMLASQGTSVTKENVSALSITQNSQSKTFSYIDDMKTSMKKQKSQKPKCKEIILSFNSAISEIVNNVPSLKHLCNSDSNQISSVNEP